MTHVSSVIYFLFLMHAGIVSIFELVLDFLRRRDAPDTEPCHTTIRSNRYPHVANLISNFVIHKENMSLLRPHLK